MARVARTVIVRSAPLPRKKFNALVELEGMYRNMVEQLVMHAVRNGIRSFIRLKALKYREMRKLYPHLPRTTPTRPARTPPPGLRASLG